MKAQDFGNICSHWHFSPITTDAERLFPNPILMKIKKNKCLSLTAIASSIHSRSPCSWVHELEATTETGFIKKKKTK